MEQLEFAIPCLFGLEGPVADEVRRLGLEQVRGETGRVLCAGGWQDIPRLNLNLRCGERVLIRLGSFPAPTFDALFEGVRALPWEEFLPREAAFPVQGRSVQSRLHSIPACQAIVQKAAARRLGQVYGLTRLPETGAVYQVRFGLLRDRADLYLDTTGPGLYKRGYRARGVEAPLRETLAAALVTLSRYRGRDPFCDPFCGSGTIVIEAALAAKNRAPGLNRSFAGQSWPQLPAALWRRSAEEARDKEYSGSYTLWGGDIDPQAVELARHNARQAGVEELVRFQTADGLAFQWDAPYGRVVTNPPYGERMLEHRQAEELYRGFGRVWRRMPPGWKLYLLSSHTEFERTFGRTADRRRKLYNGMLKCDLFMYGV